MAEPRDTPQEETVKAPVPEPEPLEPPLELEADPGEMPLQEADLEEEAGEPHEPVRKTSGPPEGKPRRWTLAVDFGSSTLKAVVVQPGDPFRIIWWGIYEADSASGEISEPQALMVLKEWLQEIGSVEQIVVGATQDQIFVRYFQLPVETESEFEQAVLLEIQSGPDFQKQADRIEVIPLMRVPGDETGWMGLAYIIKEDRLFRLYEQLKSMHKARVYVRPSVLGPASLYLPGTFQKTVALVDLGAQYTRISILCDGKICLVREVPTGSESLTRELMRTDTDRAQAEFRKRHATLTSVADEFDQHSLAIHGREVSVWSVNQWITDIRNTMAYFEMHHSATVDDIRLLGGGVFLSALTEILELELKTEVKRAALPDHLEVTCQQELEWFTTRFPRFAVAIGLALPPEPSAGILNLAPGKLRQKIPLSRTGILAFIAAALVLFSAAFIPRWLIHDGRKTLQNQHTYLQELKSQIDRLEFELEQETPLETETAAASGMDVNRLLDWFAEHLPDNAWLNSIQITGENGDAATVEGQARFLSDVRLLLQRLMTEENRPGELQQFEAERQEDGSYQYSAKLMLDE